MGSRVQDRIDAMIIWLIGLSGSGKTTIGRVLHELLEPRYPSLVFLDGDEFRHIMGDDLGYSYEDRRKNARRLSHLCAFLDRQHVHMICAILSKRLIPLLPVRLDIDVRNATVSAGGLRKSQRSPCLIRAFQQWEGTQHHALPEPRG